MHFLMAVNWKRRHLFIFVHQYRYRTMFSSVSYFMYLLLTMPLVPL